MILFVADYPRPENEKDGMMQRIAAVDARFRDVERSYLKISFVSFLRGEKDRPSELLTVYRLNFFLHFLLIVYLACKARCIYVHSVGNALAILPFYLFRPCVTDMHGVVPDEFRLMGRRSAALRYQFVEQVAVRRSRAIVTVSEAMADHFHDKYGISRSRILNVPIFDEVAAPDRSGAPSLVPTVIYAGGTQAWQNVDMMVSAMEKTSAGYHFVILTADLRTFSEKLGGSQVPAEIKSVPKSEVYCYYGRSELGFVLRDDDLVNRVACPTKLVEYLSCGVIPIVIQPRIGDFDRHGYAYLTLADFINGETPSAQALQSMREQNYRVIESMKTSALSEMQRLVHFCTGCDQQVANAA
jgi:hypothetical protein